MNRIFLPLFRLIQSRVFWFVVGLAFVPVIRNLEKMTRSQTAFEAMGWVSHYSEQKHMCNFLPDFTYSLRFPGDREKFESFVKKMNLQDHKVSEDEYKEGSGEGGRSVRFSEKDKGFEIEFNAYQT